MGMYSFFEDEDIEVKDLKGLKNFLKIWKEEYGVIPISLKGKQVSFAERWDNIKLISYWYDEDVLFFKAIAPYIEGQVRWRFENDDEAGFIEFTKGSCIIHTGQMNWDEEVAQVDRKIIPDAIYKSLVLGAL